MLLWNLEETAKQLGNISPRTVQRLIQRGELTVVRVGRCVRCKRTHGLRRLRHMVCGAYDDSSIFLNAATIAAAFPP